MGSEWDTVQIGDCCEILSSKRIFAKEYVETGVPFYRSKEIIEKYKGNDVSTPLFITRVRFEEIKERFGVPTTNDILLTSVGTLGIPYQVQENDEFYFKDGNLTWFREFTDKICSDFLYQWLQSTYAKRAIDNITIGSTQQALTISSLKTIELKLPPLPEQKAIAHILGSLDDKIELNRQMNQTLEQMAQAMFKSWFVDFDPVIDNALAQGNEIPEELQPRAEQRLALGENRKPLPEHIQKLFPSEFEFSEELDKWVPKGWRVGHFDELANVKYGKDHKKLSDGNIPVYGSGGIMRYADSSLYTGESVLIPRKGTLSNIMYVNEEFWSVDTMFYTVMKEEGVVKYLFYNLKMLDFDMMNVGSAVPSMTTQVLNNLNILIPDIGIIKQFDGMLKDYYTKKNLNDKQTNQLTNLRDTLLPKLISGEVRVSDLKTETIETQSNE